MNHKYIKKNSPLFLLLILFCTACTFNQTYINREEDKKEANKITDAFYKNLLKEDYNEIYKLFSDGGQPNNLDERNSKLKSMFDLAKIKFGEMTKKELIQCQTKVVKGKNPSGEYNLSFQITRSQNSTIENFKLALENNSIKVVDYNIAPQTP